MVWSRWAASALWLLVACREAPRVLGGHSTPPPDGTALVCPVTGERCPKGPELDSAVFQMRTFYFCRPESRAVFAENPERYAFQ